MIHEAWGMEKAYQDVFCCVQVNDEGRGCDADRELMLLPWCCDRERKHAGGIDNACLPEVDHFHQFFISWWVHLYGFHVLWWTDVAGPLAILWITGVPWPHILLCLMDSPGPYTTLCWIHVHDLHFAGCMSSVYCFCVFSLLSPQKGPSASPTFCILPLPCFKTGTISEASFIFTFTFILHLFIFTFTFPREK